MTISEFKKLKDEPLIIEYNGITNPLFYPPETTFKDGDMIDISEQRGNFKKWKLVKETALNIIVDSIVLERDGALFYMDIFWLQPATAKYYNIKNLSSH